MLQTGEADIISPLPAIQVDKLKDDASLDVLNLGGLTYRYATLNKNYTLADGRKPLDDVRVRQAMNYAFDSEAYTQLYSRVTHQFRHRYLQVLFRIMLSPDSRIQQM